MNFIIESVHFISRDGPDMPYMLVRVMLDEDYVRGWDNRANYRYASLLGIKLLLKSQDNAWKVSISSKKNSEPWSYLLSMHIVIIL